MELFTVAEYYRMAEAGIFTENDRVELIEGEVVAMSPIGARHAACVDELSVLLRDRLLGEKMIIRVQNPVRLNDYSETQPDLAVLRPRDDYYWRFQQTRFSSAEAAARHGARAVAELE